jgi:preprotein translocase subunit YajC
VSELFYVIPLLAQAEADGGGDAAPWANIVPLMPLLLIFVLYIFLIQRPQRREQVARQAMLKNVKKNDRVITTAGIYGVVTSVQADSDEVTIRVDEANNTKLRMSLGSVARVIGSDSSGE